MTPQLGAALEIWRTRTRKTRGDQAYLVYAILLGVAVVIVPIVRAVWLSAVSDEGIRALSAPAAPAVAGLAAVALWAAALLLGRERGPALLAPFLSHALATSGLRRAVAFRSPVLRSAAVVIAVTTAVAVLAGTALLHRGLADPLGVVAFAVAGALVGCIASVGWLAGQALPRIAPWLALGLLVFGACTAIAPVVRPFSPWGWVELLYPTVGTPFALAALVALAVGLAATAPTLLDRLSATELTAQALRWEAATTHTSSMDFSLAADIYRGRPHLGRGIRAVASARSSSARPRRARPARRLPAVFLRRDAVGAIRTPGRLVVGVLALAAAGALLALAATPAAPGWLLGAIAGLVAYAGLGAFTDGIRHAASVAADLPLYGVSDARLLANHSAFPLIVAIVVLLAAVVTCALVFALPVAAPIAGALAFGPLALLARIGSALKGPMPPVLLTPIPTPMGDMGAAMRLIWAVDGLLIAAIAGASAALLLDAPAVVAIVALVLVGTALNRWRHRRA